MPDFTHENKYTDIIAGLDEVGIGPLSGPVVAAAVIITYKEHEVIQYIDDSKKLSPVLRESLYHAITRKFPHGIGMATVKEITELNIFHAAKLAMRRAVNNLPVRPKTVLIDGNHTPFTSEDDYNHACIVKGDSLSISIAAASIVAKVTRDNLMIALSKSFPVYNWYKNKGYPTKGHRQAILQHGITIHHRYAFVKHIIL